MDRFSICWPFVLLMEAPNPTNWSSPVNYSNDPHDPGGATMEGVIQTEYDRYREGRGLPVQDVRLITRAEGADIYTNSYWLPRSPGLPAGFDLSWFDTDVNCGPGGATRILQSALGVASDGQWGPITQAAVDAIADVAAAIRAFTAAREAYYRRLSGWQYFGPGWIHRAVAINQDSLSMLTNLRGLRIARPFVKTVKAYPEAA